ncbi:hydrolase [Vibrio parahaemolyticus]|uniref:NlpC/P60 family protein n=1 Tax=Vibrio parahaemolyticus TaxID=670 RepID=UPI0008133077|nr:NlpC/P60 family protein [Vibrio parahaemolyticus]EJG1663417.1 C40 family peptidase [Vibrio parahaemolyticus]EJG1682046.1 C40 family peptidase [Vibrio parahaemolyticus]EJG1771449.1 C40 family peptidase [Vibrio parahaemolyticus]EJG1793709.1 C40 family peptidase [Vibrio parahaemolyticus]MDF4379677.1 NlpC/P60 family protein [Vibrio parahaemolyticus]
MTGEDLRRIYFPLIISALLSACSSGPEPSEQVEVTVPTNQLLSNNPDLFQFYNEWHGTPYRLGGTKKSGIDCSAFVQRAFVEAYQLALPRTTKQQSTQGVELSWTDAKQGDLVFFKTRRSTYHVGIYLGNKQFMHASTSKGVIISRIDNPYWASKFWQVRRVTL